MKHSNWIGVLNINGFESKGRNSHEFYKHGTLLTRTYLLVLKNWKMSGPWEPTDPNGGYTLYWNVVKIRYFIFFLRLLCTSGRNTWFVSWFFPFHLHFVVSTMLNFWDNIRVLTFPLNSHPSWNIFVLFSFLQIQRTNMFHNVKNVGR